MTFLSTLHNRHQTLEDLRAELRTRSQDLNKELLDLVNENYQDFLSLGSSLKGGDEKVEEVRLGLLGFKREVEGLRGKVDARRGEIKTLIGKRKRIVEEVQLGRKLLEIETKIGELEERLMLASGGVRKPLETGPDAQMSDSEEESEDEAESSSLATSKLRRHVEQYMYITKSIERTGDDHPFLVQQEGRVQRLKQTVLLDLNSALKHAVVDGEQSRGELLMLLAIYKEMDQVSEAMKVLKESKQR